MKISSIYSVSDGRRSEFIFRKRQSVFYIKTGSTKTYYADAGSVDQTLSVQIIDCALIYCHMQVNLSGCARWLAYIQLLCLKVFSVRRDTLPARLFLSTRGRI